MISVLSRLLQSSGNNNFNRKYTHLAILLVFGLLLSACAGTDKAVRRSPNQSTKKTTKRGDVTKVKKKVKEIEWTEAKDDAKPPIERPKVERLGDIEILKEDIYDITYFIPFDAGNYANSQSASDRFVQYYSGLLIATEILEREGVSLNLNIVDEKKRSFNNLLPSSISADTDVIIGPYNRNNLKAAARLAAQKQIPIVSPWQASATITKENPYYIQLRPNTDNFYYAILEDIKKKYSDLENVYLLGREASPKDNDKKRTRKLQKLAKDVWGKSDENHLQEFMLSQDSIDIGETAFDSIFVVDKPNVMIIPNWSFKDEAFVYGALRRLSVEKGITDVVVYGMPIMIESDKINFDQYNSLNMRVARSKFVDEYDGDVARFKRDFVNKYGALPTDDAFEGYDNLMFIGRNLKKHGKNFQYFLNKDQGYYLQAKYNVEATRKDSPDDRLQKINYFENKNVDIIEFKNNRFARKIR
jgi:hypothetical protein